MANICIYKNEDINRIVAFIPPGHKHIRLLIETKDQCILLQEATIAAIVRAYINITTHPTRKAVELIRTCISYGKKNYAKYQLIESNRLENEIIDEVMNSINK